MKAKEKKVIQSALTILEQVRENLNELHNSLQEQVEEAQDHDDEPSEELFSDIAFLEDMISSLETAIDDGGKWE
jgi:DNA-binding ferritin-like protein